jgi:uncharacterized 2Fe-2S/4Fe-4S cluster protein (DUF4445 family)
LVTQGDIRAIQLAKSALYAGARLLMDEMGVDRVDRVVLAGAFGAHISPKHAMVLGMIPDVPLNKVFSAGNAAGTGARIALLNRGARDEIEGWCMTSTRSRPRSSRAFRSISSMRTRFPMRSMPFPNWQRCCGCRRCPSIPAVRGAKAAAAAAAADAVTAGLRGRQ